MAFTIDGTTIKAPNNFRREYITTQVDHTTINGQVKRNFTRRKEKFYLEYQYILGTEKNQLITFLNQNQTHVFAVSETNLNISNTTVLMDIESREYPANGEDMIESFTVILTEVQ